MMVPLYAFLRGDTMGLVILVDDSQTVREVGEVLQQAAIMRVAPAPQVRIFAHGRLLDPDSTVAQVGLAPLDRVDAEPVR